MLDLQLHLSIALAFVENLFRPHWPDLLRYDLLEKRIRTVSLTTGSDLHDYNRNEEASLSVALMVHQNGCLAVCVMPASAQPRCS